MIKEANSEKKPGEIIFADDKKGLFVKTKDGVLSILELQPENSKKMTFGDYVRGQRI